MVLSKAKIQSIVENFIENADEKDLKNLSELIDKKTTEKFWKQFEDKETSREPIAGITFIWPVF